MQRKRRASNNNWVGGVIFLIIMFGSPLSSFLASTIRQSTGVSIDSGMIFGGLIILGVIISALGSLGRGLGQIKSSSETRLPTASSSAPLPPNSMPAQLKQSQLPGAPRYEPIIDRRILIFGVIGLIFFGIVFLVILGMTGTI
ncbi:MAG: hypothetical protein HGA65_08740 [Oscillochloris sp.]|nr:hypothetical protein [Oscillochloris sp.]